MAVFSRHPREHWLKPHFSKNEVANSGRLTLEGSARLAAQNKAARGTSGRVRRAKSALGFATVPHDDAPASFARHSRRDAASPEYRLLASLAPVGAIREPHPRVSLRSALGHSPRFLITC